MQPSDKIPAQTPPPAGGSKPPKQSFWAKLLGIKPKVPDVPVHESLAPPPRLDDNAPEPGSGPLQTAAPQTDPILGNPEAADISAPDQNGEVTALPIVVPSHLQTPVDGKAPTVQTANQPAPQPINPLPLAEPTQPMTPTPPAPVVPLTPPSVPPSASQQPAPQPQPPQPPTPPQG